MALIAFIFYIYKINKKWQISTFKRLCSRTEEHQLKWILPFSREMSKYPLFHLLGWNWSMWGGGWMSICFFSIPVASSLWMVPQANNSYQDYNLQWTGSLQTWLPEHQMSQHFLQIQYHWFLSHCTHGSQSWQQSGWTGLRAPARSQCSRTGPRPCS